MRDKRERLLDQVRQAVRESGLSHYAVCKAARIDKATMSRFMAGQCGITVRTLDALADVLGLRIVTDKRKKGR